MIRVSVGCVLVFLILSAAIGNRGTAEDAACVTDQCIHTNVYRSIIANDTTITTYQVKYADCRPCGGSTSRCRGPGGDPKDCKDTSTPQFIRYVKAKDYYCDLPAFPKGGKAEASLLAGDYREESYDPFGFVRECPAKGPGGN